MMVRLEAFEYFFSIFFLTFQFHDGAIGSLAWDISPSTLSRVSIP